MVAKLEEDASQAFEEGGADGLASHLRRLDAKLPGKRFLVDADGRDLVDGSDRSALVRSIGGGYARLPDGQLAVMSEPEDVPIASSGSSSPGSTPRVSSHSSPWSWRSTRSWGPPWPSTSPIRSAASGG